MNSAGFTLVEIVIGMAILSMVLLTATFVFSTIVQLQQTADVVQDIQQTARYVEESIARDVRNSDRYRLDNETPPVQLTLPNRLDQEGNSQVQYTFAEDEGVFRVQCDEECPSYTSTDAEHLTSGVRLTDFKVENDEDEDDESETSTTPVQVFLRLEQLNPDLEESDSYSYRYETTTIAVPRR